MATEKNDWIDVKLSEFGEEHLRSQGGGPLRIQEGNGGQGFVFQSGEIQRVTRAFDWERVLKPWHINGHALFEFVPPPEEVAAVAHLRDEGINATAEEDDIRVDLPGDQEAGQ